MIVRQYEQSDRDTWNEFIESSKNGTFLFDRNYMDYHSNRFKDNSLMIFDSKEKLVAVLPANKRENILLSHGGLTYGGLITNDKITTPLVIEIFSDVLDHLKTKGFTTMVYKTIPYIYHRTPAEEDRYPLFLLKAHLSRRDVLSVVFRDYKVPYQERRHRSVKKALKNNITVKESTDFKEYWKILEWNLKTQYNLIPVHSYEEMEMLQGRFPDKIKLFASYCMDKMLGGLIIYETHTVAHNQYSANSEEGKTMGAVDIIFDKLLNEDYKDKPYFDFGISNEQEGNYLNKGLIEYKESFGARAITHDFYELNF